MKKVEINGILWASENATDVLLDLDKGKQLVKLIEGRLPTIKELEDLSMCGSTWDTRRKGRWFGPDHKRKGRSTQSIFFPAAGLRDVASGTVSSQGSRGYYWSSAPTNTTIGYNLYFSGNAVYPSLYISQSYGMAVRCVYDIVK